MSVLVNLISVELAPQLTVCIHCLVTEPRQGGARNPEFQSGVDQRTCVVGSPADNARSRPGSYGGGYRDTQVGKGENENRREG